MQIYDKYMCVCACIHVCIHTFSGLALILSLILKIADPDIPQMPGFPKS